MAERVLFSHVTSPIAIIIVVNAFVCTVAVQVAQKVPIKCIKTIIFFFQFVPFSVGVVITGKRRFRNQVNQLYSTKVILE